MNYLVLYNNEDYTHVDAENLEDCIIQFAKYTGCNTELFLKSLKGCQSPKDYVRMYEHFSDYNINSILLIQQAIYDEEADGKCV